MGNGAAEFIVVVGIVMDDNFGDEVEVVAGDPYALDDSNFENPIALYDTMAEKLNVGLNDTIRIRFTTAYGQVQAAQFTVVTLLKATNPFMSVASFTSLETMKPLIGLEPQESQSLSVIMNELDDPKIVIEQAQRLHEALQPGVAGYMGTLQAAGGNTQSVQALAVRPELSVHQAFEGSMQVVGGQVSGFWDNRELAMLSRSMAQALGVQPGGSISLTYETKFQGMFGPRSFRVAAIFES
ncbi:MAG: hypothetical protein GY794_26515, partial [bacterium]|nr:hypothetical protein [bacterium]